MTCTGTTIYLSPGQDWSAEGVMPDGLGGAADLTGFTASAEASGELAGVGIVAVTIPDPANGVTRRAITWQAGWSLAGRVLGRFRERYVLGAQDSATNLITVVVDDTVTDITAYAGADFDAEFVFPDDDGDPADLTGQTVAPFNVTGDLVGRVAVAVLDAASGSCRVTIEGNPALAVGVAGTFQIMRSYPGPTNRRTLNVQKVTIR
jgi:hypothetical protein